jgi:4-hydroxy-tetrahydrodipicolinate synthase
MVPPVVLPFDDRGAIDFDSLGNLVRHLVANGANALWVNGSCGDFTSLSEEERADVVRAAVEAAAGVPVIAGVGDAATRPALRHAEAAVAAGANAVAVVPPYYALYAEDELARHVRLVASTSDLPVFIYYNPSFTKVTLSVGFVVELALDGVIVGFKDAAGDVDFFRRLINGLRAADVSIATYTASAVLADVYLLLGASGTMCGPSNFLPGPIKALLNAHTRGDTHETYRIRRVIEEAMSNVVLPARKTWPPFLAAYRYILWELGIISSPTNPPPVTPLSSTERKSLKSTALPPIIRANESIAIRR